MRVEEIMTKEVFKISDDMTLKQASHLMNKYKVRHLPVVKDNKLIGMISKSDLVRLCFAEHLGEEENDLDEVLLGDFTLEHMMVRNLTVIPPKATVAEAADVIMSKEFHALPVVENDELVGIITTTDIIRCLLSLAQTP